MQFSLFALLLVVRIYNLSGLSGADMRAATGTASDPLRRADFEIVWLECSSPGAGAVSRCAATPRPDEVIVRISAAPAGSSDAHPGRERLGFAYVDSGSGALATVYADRIATMATHSGVDAATLLGRAIAHEIGHLLLGDGAHARYGLMRAEWSPALLRRGFAGDWQFSTTERHALAANLKARVERAAAACPWSAVCPDCPIPCGAQAFATSATR